MNLLPIGSNLNISLVLLIVNIFKNNCRTFDTDIGNDPRGRGGTGRDHQTARFIPSGHGIFPDMDEAEGHV